MFFKIKKVFSLTFIIGLLMIITLIVYLSNSFSDKTTNRPNNKTVKLSNAKVELYPVEVNNKWGYINQKGTIIIQPEYEQVGMFNKFGVSLVITGYENPVEDKTVNHNIYYKDALCKIIDYTGKIIQDGLILENHEEINKSYYNMSNIFDVYLNQNPLIFKLKSSNKYVKINQEGKVTQTYNEVSKRDYEMLMLPNPYSNATDPENSELVAKGYKISCKKTEGFDLLGLISPTGELLLKSEWTEIKYIGEGVFQLLNYSDEGKYYYEQSFNRTFFNAYKNKFFKVQCVKAADNNNGFITLYDNDSTFFIDSNGNPINIPKVNGIQTVFKINSLFYVGTQGGFIYYDNNFKPVWKSIKKPLILGEGITCETKSITSDYTYRAQMPVYSGLSKHAENKINKSIEDLYNKRFILFKEQMKDFISIKDNTHLLSSRPRYDITFDSWRTGNILQVIVNCQGSTSKNFRRCTFSFDINTGEEYKLRDLFKDNSLDMINHLIFEKFNKQYILFSGSDFLTRNHDFYIKNHVLIVCFEPYEVASGFVEVKFDFEKLDKLVDKSGAFWNALNP